VVQLAIRNGVIVAIIGATRYYFAPDIEDLDRRDPNRRAITNLCQLVLADGGSAPGSPSLRAALVFPISGTRW
jgi:hypothetical protein